MSSKPDASRRNERSRRAILAATVALISELGYEQTSIEGIARRAGVGKQTIYRWWPSKGAVVLEALDESLASVVDFPDSGDIVEDLRVQMTGVTELLGTSEVGAVYKGLIAAAQSDPVLSRAHLDQVIEPANVACRARLALARERGEIRADVDDQTIIDLLWGSIYLRLLLHTRPLEPQQVDATLQIAFEGLHVHPTASVVGPRASDTSAGRPVSFPDGPIRVVLDGAVTTSRPDPSRRNERSHQAILAATIALVAELGYDNVSIEALARRAGVGKQTIYRWWSKKGEVVLEALDDSLATVVDFQDSGDIVEDLRHHMTGVTQLLSSTQIGPVIQGLIAAAQSDPVLSRAHFERVIEPAIVVWTDRIARAQASGEIRGDADPQAVIDMLFGAMYYRLLLYTRPSEPAQIDAALQVTFDGLHPSAVRSSMA